MSVREPTEAVWTRLRSMQSVQNVRSRRWGRERGRRRGQTTLDFAIGMSVFLIAVVFVLTFAPNMLDPFTGLTQEKTVLTARVADQLAEGMLGSPAEPYVLNETCTLAFFNESYNDAGCQFSNTISVGQRLGVTTFDLNVTLERDVTGGPTTEVVCWDESAGTLTECTGAGDAWPVKVGSAPTNARSIIVARRLVSFGGEDATLVVRVW